MRSHNRSKSEIIENIDLAFEQFEFSVRLWFMLNVSDLDEKRKEWLTSHFEVPLRFEVDSEHGCQRCEFTSSLFQSFDALSNGACNNLSTMFGMTAMAMAEAMEALPNPKYHKDDSQPEEWEMVAVLIKQIRNAFAHNILYPFWDVRPDWRGYYQISFELPNGKMFEIDLKKLNKQQLSYEQIGLENWFQIKVMSKDLIIDKKQ